jgi:hypothetical protein
VFSTAYEAVLYIYCACINDMVDEWILIRFHDSVVTVHLLYCCHIENRPFLLRCISYAWHVFWLCFSFVIGCHTGIFCFVFLFTFLSVSRILVKILVPVAGTECGTLWIICYANCRSPASALITVTNIKNIKMSVSMISMTTSHSKIGVNLTSRMCVLL